MNNLGKKALMFLIVMMAVAATAWFGRRAYKAVAGRRLVAQASHYLETRDLTNAALCLQHALQLDPLNGKASKVMADALEAAGLPSALGWRAHSAKYDPENITNRFLWAETAIKLRNFGSAQEALGGVDLKYHKTANYQKLAGALAWAQGINTQAELHYTVALRIEPTNLSTVMNLATIHLASTNAVIAGSGRTALEQLTTNEVWRLPALHYLIADAITRKALTAAIQYSTAILTDPKVTCADKIQHLQLLRAGNDNRFASWLASLKHEATDSPAMAHTLGQWMMTANGPTNTLSWLQTLPDSVKTNQAVPLLVTDCQNAIQDWGGLLITVQGQNWDEAEYYRTAIEAKAQRGLTNEFASQIAWRKAVRLSDQRLDRLSRLAQLAGIWGWKLEKTETLRQLTTQFPKERWAQAQFMDELYAAGNTQELKEVLSRICTDEPSNVRLKNALANVSLLRKSELEKAYRLTREAYASLPEDPLIISTYSYSLLLQNKPDDALKVINELKPEALRDPAIAGFFGLIQAQAGNKALAKEPLERAESGKLLPEEKEMVRLAKAGL